MLLHEDHKGVVYALAFSPDGDALASGDKDGSLALRDADGEVHRLLEPGLKSPAVQSLAFLPDGSLVVGHGRGWQVHRRESGGWRAFNAPSETPTISLAVVDPGLMLVGTGHRGQSRSTLGHVQLWNLAGGPSDARPLPSQEFQREINGVRAVAACRGKGLVAWATEHRKVCVWNIRQQKPPVNFLQSHDSPGIALSPDGTILAAATDWAVRLYDVAKPRERAALKGHKGLVGVVAFSPDGTTVASGSWDETVRLWDVRTGRERACFNWPVGKIFSLAYAPDGLRIAAGGECGAVVVWDVE